jgi:uncharacterized membrane protein YheB (UPF0754 family)
MIAVDPEAPARFDLTVWDRRVRYGLLIAAAVFGLLDAVLDSGNAWVRAGFVITVAGLVGYFTNFLAIKMLFQPKQGQVLGWRGLVPKNKARIAQSLGESVQEQLLAPDIIIAYIRERQLIEVGTQSAADWVDAQLQQPQVRRDITEWLVQALNQYGPDQLGELFDFTETALKALARNPEIIETNWQRFRVVLIEFLRLPENREMAAQAMQRVVVTHLPDIAVWLNQALENYLQQKRVGGVGLGLKNLFSFDQKAIQQLLTRFAEDPQVADQVMTGLDAVMDRLQHELQSEALQTQLQTHLESWIESAADLSRRHLLPGVIEQLGDYLNEPANWQQIEEHLIEALQWAKQRSLAFLNSAEGTAALRAAIERGVQKLNVTELVQEQVMQLDTDELEKMVLDNSGGNFTVIQVLGGALGIIVGTVQVHLLFVVPLAGLLGVVWVAWSLNERRGRAQR